MSTPVHAPSGQEILETSRERNPLRGTQLRRPRALRSPAPAPAVSTVPHKIPRALLLGIYGIIPIALGVALTDLLVFNGSLRAKLPYSPDELLVFAVFFNLPHIVASSVGFADMEYLKHYRAKIIAPALVLIATLAIYPGFFETPVFSGVLYLWTVIHVIGQQFGMIRLMGRNMSKYLDLWKWVAISLGAAIYLGTYVPGKDIGQTDEWVRHVTLSGAWALSIPFAWLAWKVHSQAETKIGKQSVLANAAMIASILALYSLGYSFFLILIPRFIHDLSAFVFYTAHDLNRNRPSSEAEPNLIYRALVSTGIPMRLLSPAVALALAFPLTYYYQQDVSWAYRAAVALTLFHYYTDRFVWKNGSPQRRFIALS